MVQFDDAEAEEQFDRDIDSYESFLNRRFDAQLRLPRFAQVIALAAPQRKIEASEQFVR